MVKWALGQQNKEGWVGELDKPLYRCFGVAVTTPCQGDDGAMSAAPGYGPPTAVLQRCHSLKANRDIIGLAKYPPENTWTVEALAMHSS